jgi:dTDP-glucose 4,6-dehydratase
MIAEVMGAEIELEMEQVRLRPDKSEVERLWADNRKAGNLLDWHPLYAGKEGFKRGLAETVAWFQRPDNLKGYKFQFYNL